MKVALAMGNRVKQARRLGGIADILKETGEWAKAREYYSQAIETLRETEDEEQLAGWLEELSELYRMQHKWDDALQTKKEAMTIWRKMARRERQMHAKRRPP